MTSTYVFTGVAGSQSNEWYGELDTLDSNGNIINQEFNWTYYPNPPSTSGSYPLNALFASDPLPTTATDVSIGPAGGSAAYQVTISGQDSYGKTAAAHIATIAAGSSVTISGPGGGLTLGSGLVNDGELQMKSGGTLYTGGDTVTLSGGGQIVMSYLQDGYPAQIRAGASQQTLVNQTTITGTGHIGARYGTLYDDGNELNFVNDVGGLVDANGTALPGYDDGQIILQMHDAITNNGILRGSGTGGLLIFQGTVHQGASGRIEAVGAGSLATLAGVTVQGGTFATSSGGVVALGNYGGNSGGANLLDGASSYGAIHNQGSFLVADGTAMAAKGTLDNSGTITLNATGHSATLQVSQGDLTLTGGGTIQMTSVPGGYYYNNLITGYDPNTTAVLHNVNNTITGTGTIGSNYGNIYDAGFDLTLDNQAGGVIKAAGSGDQTLQLNMHQAVSNAGALIDTGTAGLLINSTTVNQSGQGYIGADGKGAHVDLRQATINGGSFVTTNGGVIHANSTTLDGSTTAGAITNLGMIDSAYMTINGQIINRGSITGYIDVGTGGATLSGGGNITLANLSGYSSLLHNIDNTISGAGSVSVAFQNDIGGVINANDSSSSLTIFTGGTDINAGLIEATGAAGMSIANSIIDQRSGGHVFVGDGSVVHFDDNTTLMGGSLQGSGTGYYDLQGSAALAAVNIAATVKIGAGYTLSDVGDVANTGSLLLNGGTLQVNGHWTGGGHLALATGSTISVTGALTNTDNLISGVGTIATGVTGASLTNAGTIDANVSGGVLALAGDLAFANNGVLEAENGGTLSIASAVTGSGSALVKDGGTLVFANAFDGNVTFSGDGTSETLRLAQSYGGRISDLGQGDKIDFTTLNYASDLHATYATDQTGGTLSVFDANNNNLASLHLTGKYSASGFGLSDDGAGHTLLTTNSLLASPILNEKANVTVGSSVSGTAGIGGTGALAGDTAPNGATLSVSAIQGGQLGTSVAGQYGHLTLNADGSYNYVADNLLALAEAQAAAGVYSQIQLTGTSSDITAIRQAASAQPLHDQFGFTVSDGHGNLATSTLDVAVTVVSQGTPNSDVGLPGPGNAFTVVHFDNNGLIGTITQTKANGSNDAFGYTITQDGHLVPNETHQQAPASETFAFKFSEAHFSFTNGHDVMTEPNGSIVDVTGVHSLTFTDGTVTEHAHSPLVDDLYYDATNSDVWAAHIDPTTHYNQNGWHEGRNPNPDFSTVGYLAANPDVAKAGLNPLTHYDQNGWKEGRDPSANFDNELYLKNNPDVAAAGIDPLSHYLSNGQFEGRQTYAAIGQASSFTHGSFDAEYYLLANPDVAKAALASGGDTFTFAYQHYEANGWHEGRNPDADFNTAYYLAQNPDVGAAGIDPLTHYDLYGWKEGRNPSAAFNTHAYLAANPDVAAAHIDPLLHYLQNGAGEGRHLA